MTFDAVNPWMTEAAARIPAGVPAVLFMRHAERYSNPPDGDYSRLLLTPAGIQAANAIGASVDRRIGVLRSSRVERCRQTLREIVRCVPPQFAPEGDIRTCPEFCELLGDPSPREEGGVGWYEYFHYLQLHDTAGSRGVTLEAEAGRILDAIFRETDGCFAATDSLADGGTGAADSDSCADSGNGAGTGGTTGGGLSLICSHDGQVVILASALFGLKTGTAWSEAWCRFAEGIFFWGRRDDFTALWRWQERRFRNFLGD